THRYPGTDVSRYPFDYTRSAGSYLGDPGCVVIDNDRGNYFSLTPTSYSLCGLDSGQSCGVIPLEDYLCPVGRGIVTGNIHRWFSTPFRVADWADRFREAMFGAPVPLGLEDGSKFRVALGAEGFKYPMLLADARFLRFLLG